MNIAKLLILTTLLSATYGHAELFTWVDSEGRKHFGDSIPEEYKDQAEVLEVKPLNTVAPEKEIKLQNTKAVQKLKREDRVAENQARQARERSEEERQAERNAETQLSREMCRDNNVTVKKRTECFNRIKQ